MATLRDIRRRISGVKSTQKITKAMKMVAAAKLRRAQDAIIAARPYAGKMKEFIAHLSGTVDLSANPLFTVKPVEKVAIVVVTADRGLCGAFNSNLIRTASNHITTRYQDIHREKNVKLICVGKKGFDFFAKRDYPVTSKYLGIFAGLQFAHAQSVVKLLTDGFLNGEYDRIEIVYNEFKSVIQQRTIVEQFLPLTPSDLPLSNANLGDGTHGMKSMIDYIYEPSSEAILTALVPRHLNFQMWRIMLESNASEQGARMAAMDNATTNASDLIRNLQLSYNKARQASITKELLEIVSGAEALKKAG